MVERPNYLSIFDQYQIGHEPSFFTVLTSVQPAEGVNTGDIKQTPCPLKPIAEKMGIQCAEECLKFDNDLQCPHTDSENLFPKSPTTSSEQGESIEQGLPSDMLRMLQDINLIADRKKEVVIETAEEFLKTNS